MLSAPVAADSDLGSCSAYILCSLNFLLYGNSELVLMRMVIYNNCALGQSLLPNANSCAPHSEVKHTNTRSVAQRKVYCMAMQEIGDLMPKKCQTPQRLSAKHF